MGLPLASRTVRAPRPWEARALPPALDALPPAARRVAEGAAGSSPHLAHLLAREARWIAGALDDPEAALDAALAEAAAPATPRDLAPALRRAKARVGLLAALMDLAGAWPLEAVTGALTRLADLAVHRALVVLVAEAAARGRLPDLGPGEDAGGLVALAMGKMGAHELNYSSDVDLVLLFDDARPSCADLPAARAGFVRVARAMTALLSDRTPEGYVFRVDLRLRPDAAVTPVALSMGAAEQYYESLGRTWERAAYIKARPAGGDLDGGARFLRTLTPFVWRRHLDFAAIEDAHDMRLRIRDHHAPVAFALDGHDLKLGRGGIREIEFFTQTRQLIAGGRDSSLRLRGTVEALHALARAGWIGADVAATLAAHYRAHREVEHRLQMIADLQTHALPETPEGWGRLAALMDRDVEALRREVADRIEEVHALTEGFFAPDAAPAPEAWGEAVTSRWPAYPALRSERAVAIFRRLLPSILQRLREAARPDEALAELDRFLLGLPAGVQLFSLFERNPSLLRLLVDIVATAPALARDLAQRPGVLDAVLGGSFFAPWPGPEGLRAGLAAALAEGADYERALDRARAWLAEWRFRVGVHHLQGLVDADEAGAQHADLADATLAAVLPLVAANLARRHGAPPGRCALLGMGSLGAGRLTATSDLDLIVIYDAAGARGGASDGPRPLAAGAWYARLTQGLVTALQAPMAQGRLYEVDMRLRPSGRQGPVATSWGAFQAYQRGEAWTWEHLALTRARVVATLGEGLGEEVEAFRREVVGARRGDAAAWPDLRAMRARLPPGTPWDPKAGPGRLRDVELGAQALALVAGSPERSTAAQVEAGVAAGLVGRGDADALLAAADLFWRVQAAGRLLVQGPLDGAEVGEGGRRLLLRETGEASAPALLARMGATAAAAAEVIDRL